MNAKHLLSGAALAASLAGAAAANAATHVIGVEDSTNGFVGDLFNGAFPGPPVYIVASDGERRFDPFGAGFDTSDGLNFSQVRHVWTQAADSHWTALGHQTWVLPALTSCGVEVFETACEPVGHFISPDAWSSAAIGTWEILESPNGRVSDVIKTFNTATGAEVLFISDVPEPATWAMLLVGLGAIGAAMRTARRRDRTSTVAVA